MTEGTGTDTKDDDKSMTAEKREFILMRERSFPLETGQ